MMAAMDDGQERHLDWEGCANARDLGGLPTADGRRTRRGVVVRADALDHLTDAGWASLWAHGVRTVVDLRNDDELAADRVARPDGLATVRVPLDGTDDEEFWARWASGPQFGTPLYYGPHLQRMPERSAAAVRAIARARAGGVVFHCGLGRDRTGLVAMLVLALAGVAPADIAADYELSSDRVAPALARLGRDDDSAALARFLAERGTTGAGAILATLEAVDVAARLRAGGLTDGDVAALRARLVG
jgi:protein-tyrosine phosphatase